MAAKDRKRGTSAFLRNQRGAAAVEFALIAPIFFGLMFSILEAGVFFFVNSAVTEANAKAARLVRTGQAQGALTPDAFYDEICSVVSVFGDCSERLTVDVARFDDFSDLAADTTSLQCRDSADSSIAGAQFTDADYGARRDIVRIRVCYLHRPLNPALGLSLNKNGDGFREMVSVAIFRNEPFDS